MKRARRKTDGCPGFNTTLTLKTHKDTIPSQPALGEVLSRLKLDLPTPKLRHGDDDENGDKPRFIKDATVCLENLLPAFLPCFTAAKLFSDIPLFANSIQMHLITSTAIFTLSSPLRESTIFITYLNATARYHDDPVGHILYDLPFKVPPGISQTPRLPVDWSLGSVGYDAVKKALGGELKLNASATVGIKLGKWEERLWFVGGGIGAHVRL